MAFLVLTGLTTFIISIANAQSKESLQRIYNNETIQASGTSFIIGSKQLKFGELKSSFSSGITRDLYKKASGQRILGGITTVAAIAALVTAAVIRKDQKGAAVAFTIGGIGLNLLSFRFRKHSTELLDRAIWQRNKEILFGTTP